MLDPILSRPFDSKLCVRNRTDRSILAPTCTDDAANDHRLLASNISREKYALFDIASLYVLDEINILRPPTCFY